MTTRSRATFLTIRSEGAILPSDLLRRIVDGDRDLDGLTPAAYHLVEGERINEAINRAWSRLLGLWAGFRGAVAKLPPGDPATGLTRDRWLLPLFQELGYGRLQPARAIELNGKQYAISHAWGHVPIHLVGCGVDLDRRAPGVAGAARGSPHSLLQEVLNGADTHLWGFVSNGLRLRVLRDNVRLTRQAYVEFDLEAMFEGQVYADFALLWLLCHQSRVEAERPEQCWLERWSRAAQEQGVRALDQLRDGVERAITALGRGFLAHPANGALRERLRSGALSAQDYYRQALRLVYRLLFLFVAEERDLLLDPRASAEARERYTRFYALSGLRRLAERRVGTRHADLYRRVRLVMGLLGSDEGAPGLGLPALGGFLFSSAALPDLEEAELANHDLLEAIRALAFVQDRHGRRAVDYKNLGSEELGSVYESLLELRPVLNLDAPDFALERVGGSERKTSGSYYTPGSLIACLLDTALDPALDAAARQPDAERAILDLKIVDPACGSGHFLIAAAHRLARRLAALRTGDDEPAPEALRAALREVIGRCIYGVDLNPMAVELCKVSLWMEALEPGKPLTFLDHHIRCGNSLIGATRDLVEQGLPDDAYRPIAGDDKAAAAAFRKRNANERKARERGQAPLPLDFGAAHGLDAAAQAARQLEAMPDASPRALREKQAAYERLRLDAYDTRVLYDLWTAAFFLPLTDPNDPTIPTSQDIWNFSQRPAAADGRMIGRAVEVARHAGFFHWELEFPQVFGGVGSGEAGSEEQGAGSGERGAGSGGLMDAEHATGDSPRRRASHPVARGFSRRADMDQPAPAGVAPAARTVNRPAPGAERARGGFDVVLGNPPWERIKLQEQEHFADVPAIARAANKAERERLINAWRNGEAWQRTRIAAYDAAKYRAEAESRFVRASGRFPLTAVGDVNTYALFAELARSLLAPAGRAGIIVPTGIATDDSTKAFFGDLNQRRQVIGLYDFENREKIFPDVDSRYKFSLLTIGHTDAPARFVFFATNVGHLADPRRVFTLTPDDLALINPNTRTAPVFRTRQDAELTTRLYRRAPVLVNERSGENPWGVRFMTMFHMSNDSHLFHTAPGAGLLPLYEAKLLHQFTHRWATYEGAGIGERGAGREGAQGPGPSRVGARADSPAPALLERGQGGEDKARELTPAELADPAVTVTPRYWVEAAEVEARLAGRWARGWLLGFRDITNATNERTAIFSLLPRVGVGHTAPLILFAEEVSAVHIACFLAIINSLAFDFVTRQKVGGTHLTYTYLNQLPVLPPSAFSAEDIAFIVPRVVELVYTAWDIQAFADDVWAELERGEREAGSGEQGAERGEQWGHLVQQEILKRWRACHGWRGDGDPLAPGSAGVAGGDGPGGAMVPGDAGRSAERAVRDDRPDPARGGGGEGDHRRGPGPRASPLPASRCPLPAPFIWNEDRRAVIRAELDARIARLYGLSRDELRYILDPADVFGPDFPGETFRVLKEKEIRQYGEYRTRRLVLEAWDREAQGAGSGA